MSLAIQIAKNTTYLAIGKFLSTALGVASIALLLRYLSPDDYGRFTTAFAFVLLFGTITDLGLNLTTTQDISLPGNNTERTLSSIFTLRVLINIGLLALLPVVLLAFPYEPMLKKAILLATPIFITQSLFQILASYFQKELKGGLVALAELLGKAAVLIATIIAVYLELEFLPLVGLIAFMGLSQLGAILYFTIREIKLSWRVDLAVWQRIIGKTWPIALSVVFTTIYFKGDTIILSLFRPFAEVGIYGAAYKVLEVLIALPILFMGLILPHITHSIATENQERFNRLIQKSWDAVSLVTLPMVAGLMVLARPIMDLVAGEGYDPAAAVLRILALALGVIFFGSIFAHAVVAINKQRAMVKYYFLAALLAVILYIIYIPRYTYFAAAWVTVFAEVIIALAAFLMVWRATKFRLSLSAFKKALFASLIMAALLIWLQALPVLLLIAFGAAAYSALIFVLGGVPEEIRPSLLSRTIRRQ